MVSRAILVFVTLLPLALGITGSPAHAQNYPWCAYYGGGMFGGGGGANCGFTSFEQCMATVNGIGGFCDRNTQYVPPAGARSQRRVQRHY
jgi:hypothetical protein